MRKADRGRVIKPSTRTVAQFFTEWFVAVQPSLDATTWQNWKDYADAYVIPRIGQERLQQLHEPQLLKLYATLLAEGRIKRNRNSEMFKYWSDRVANGENPRPSEVSEACGTTIHAARSAVRRYKSGIVPKELPSGLAPKTVRNIHAMIHRAFVDAVAWKYIAYNPANNIKPPKRSRQRRIVWKPNQIQTFLTSVQRDRFAALFLLELTTGIRRGQIVLGLASRLVRRASVRFVESLALPNPICRRLDGLVLLHPRSQGTAQCCYRRHQPGHHQQG
jgi:integrase